MDPESYSCEADAECLKNAQAIQADPERHQAALDHLSDEKTHTDAAHKHARKTLEKATKGKLDKVFKGKKEFKDSESQNKEEQSHEEESGQNGEA